MSQPDHDVDVHNHGSLFVLVPRTLAAEEWFVDHMPEDVQRWNYGYVVEPRYVDDILEGLAEAGLNYGV